MNEAVLPLAAEIEYPPPVNDKDPKVAAAPRSSTFVSCDAPEGKTRFVPAPLTGGTSQLAAVDQFASAPMPVHVLVDITSRASSGSSTSRLRSDVRAPRRAVLDSVRKRPKPDRLNDMTKTPFRGPPSVRRSAIVTPAIPVRQLFRTSLTIDRNQRRTIARKLADLPRMSIIVILATLTEVRIDLVWSRMDDRIGGSVFNPDSPRFRSCRMIRVPIDR